MWSPLWETGTECRIIKCLLKHLNGCSIEGRLTIVLPAQLGLGLKVKFAIMDKWVLESGDHQETILIQISPQCFSIMLNCAPCHGLVISNQYQYWVWWQPAPALISDIVSDFLSSVPCLVIPYLLSGLTPTSSTLNKFSDIQINADHFLPIKLTFWRTLYSK